MKQTQQETHSSALEIIEHVFCRAVGQHQFDKVNQAKYKGIIVHG
jgi:hypothetical protein